MRIYFHFLCDPIEHWLDAPADKAREFATILASNLHIVHVRVEKDTAREAARDAEWAARDAADAAEWAAWEAARAAVRDVADRFNDDE